MTNATTTIETITDEQIEGLRTEAGAAGDEAQVRLCSISLGDAVTYWFVEDSDGESPALDEGADCFEDEDAADVAIADLIESDPGWWAGAGLTARERTGVAEQAEQATARAECVAVIREAELA